jgi:DNA-binding protein YbaB
MAKLALLLFGLLIICISRSTDAFTIPIHHGKPRMTASHCTQLNMFGGAGAGMPSEDRPEEMKQMEQAAKQMGMSLEEYKLGISARGRLVESLNAARVYGGNKDTVSVERDGNNPPAHLQITITDAAKALGKEKLSSELVKALKSASDASRQTRSEEQKRMMSFIGDEMKKIGSK